LVFTSEAGTPINPYNLRERSFAPLLKEVGLPHIRFHDLRHTCPTLLLTKGIHPKFVQELLGHATIAITLATYSGYLEKVDGVSVNCSAVVYRHRAPTATSAYFSGLLHDLAAGGFQNPSFTLPGKMALTSHVAPRLPAGPLLRG
jgi:hypothetical protein